MCSLHVFLYQSGCGFRTTLPDMICVMFWSRVTAVSCSCVIMCCTLSGSHELSTCFRCRVTGSASVCFFFWDHGLQRRVPKVEPTKVRVFLRGAAPFHESFATLAAASAVTLDLLLPGLEVSWVKPHCFANVLKSCAEYWVPLLLVTNPGMHALSGKMVF